MVKTTTADGLIDWMGGLTTRQGQGQGLGQRFDVMRSGRAATTKPLEAPHTRHEAGRQRPAPGENPPRASTRPSVAAIDSRRQPGRHRRRRGLR